MALARLARFSYRRRWMVLALWIVVLVGINVVGQSIGNNFRNQFGGGNSDSAQAFQLLRDRFPAQAGDTADIVYKSDQGVASPAATAALNDLFAKVRQMPHVIGVNPPRVSAEGKVALTTVQFDKERVDLPNDTAKPLIDAVKAMPKPGGLQWSWAATWWRWPSSSSRPAQRRSA